MKSEFNHDLLKPVSRHNTNAKASLDTWSALERELEEIDTRKYYSWPSERVYMLDLSWDNARHYIDEDYPD